MAKEPRDKCSMLLRATSRNSDCVKPCLRAASRCAVHRSNFSCSVVGKLTWLQSPSHSTPSFRLTGVQLPRASRYLAEALKPDDRAKIVEWFQADLPEPSTEHDETVKVFLRYIMANNAKSIGLQKKSSQHKEV